MSLFMPSKFVSEPALKRPGRKPVGAVDFESGILQPYLGDDYALFGPFNGRYCLTHSYAVSGTTRTEANAIIANTADGDAGVHLDNTHFSLQGATRLSMLFVADLPAGNFSGTAPGDEQDIFRETDSKRPGVALASMGGTTNLRGLIHTNGTTLWTADRDISVAAYMGHRVLIAMTWDGANRFIYIGKLGEQVALVEQYVCTGSVQIDGGSPAAKKAVYCGGEHASADGPDYPVYMGLVTKKLMPKSALDQVCGSPYQFLKPRGSVW